MNARERMLRALNHEEVDRIPLFCQEIMPSFRKELLKYWGTDFKRVRKYFYYYVDFNFHKKLGFDCSWGFEGFPVHLPQSYLNEHPVPKPEDPKKYIDIDGRLFLKKPPTDSELSWYLKNYINSEEMADYFYDTYYDVEWDESPDFASKINKRLKRFPMDEIVPCAHLNYILEPIWEGIGLGLLIKLIRKNRSKIKRYIELRTKKAVQAAKMLAGIVQVIWYEPKDRKVHIECLEVSVSSFSTIKTTKIRLLDIFNM